jgi:hypothetical protein
MTPEQQAFEDKLARAYKGVVRAQFTPQGKVYHYHCPEARIGDQITGPGCTGPAEVIGYGRVNYTGPVKDATLWQPRRSKKAGLARAIAAVDWAKGLNNGGTISYHTADVKFTGAFREALATMTIDEPEEYPAMHKDGTCTIQDNIDRTEEKLRALKAAKKARKAERKAAKRAAAEKARQLKVVTDTLESVAVSGTLSAHRVAAAVELHAVITGRRI